MVHDQLPSATTAAVQIVVPADFMSTVAFDSADPADPVMVGVGSVVVLLLAGVMVGPTTAGATVSMVVT